MLFFLLVLYSGESENHYELELIDILFYIMGEKNRPVLLGSVTSVRCGIEEEKDRNLGKINAIPLMA